MKRIAAPVVGGLAGFFAVELLVYPALVAIWKRREAAWGGMGVPASPRRG